MSFPPGTEMFQFPGFALKTLCVQVSSICLNQRSSDARYRCAPIRKDQCRSARIGVPALSRHGSASTMNHLTIEDCQMGCPIRKSRDQRVLSPPPGLSQSAASFIASCRQGIHQTPFSRLIRSGSRMTKAFPPGNAWPAGNCSAIAERPNVSPQGKRRSGSRFSKMHQRHRRRRILRSVALVKGRSQAQPTLGKTAFDCPTAPRAT